MGEIHARSLTEPSSAERACIDGEEGGGRGLKIQDQERVSE